MPTQLAGGQAQKVTNPSLLTLGDFQGGSSSSWACVVSAQPTSGSSDASGILHCILCLIYLFVII